ncbi:MAG: helix-turn-helix transcriptional regulator [Ruminococcaceae bacterium]|nr:helix-turn-helix transcriptional regulator [Oscillospiraceae bacterium]
MSVQLLVNLRIYREEFQMERYLGSDDIFALVKSGSFTFSFDGEPITVGAGEGALFRKNVLYERKIITPVTMYFFRYRSDTPIFLQDKITFSDTARIQSTIALLEKLDTGVFKEEFSMRCSLFSDIVTQYAIENATQMNELAVRDARIERVIVKISESLHKKLLLSELAKEAELSYVQFLRCFKQYTGMNPSEYLAVLRLQKAKQLLSETALPIKEIAYTCGFENEYYFSNFFKKHTLTSPSEFRNASM